MWGIVPYKLKGRVWEELHTGHIGIVKVKSLARTHVWWPGVDKQIEKIVQKCEPRESLRIDQLHQLYIHGLGRHAPGNVYMWTLLAHSWIVHT